MKIEEAKIVLQECRSRQEAPDLEMIRYLGSNHPRRWKIGNWLEMEKTGEAQFRLENFNVEARNLTIHVGDSHAEFASRSCNFSDDGGINISNLTMWMGAVSMMGIATSI